MKVGGPAGIREDEEAGLSIGGGNIQIGHDGFILLWVAQSTSKIELDNVWFTLRCLGRRSRVSWDKVVSVTECGERLALWRSNRVLRAGTIFSSRTPRSFSRGSAQTFRQGSLYRREVGMWCLATRRTFKLWVQTPSQKFHAIVRDVVAYCPTKQNLAGEKLVGNRIASKLGPT